MKAALKKLLKNYANGKVSDAASNEGLKKGLIVTGVSSIGLFFGIIIIVIIVVFGPFFMAVQYIENTKNNVSLFLEKLGNVLTFQGWCADSDGSCDSKAEQKYYDKLDDVYDEYYKDGVEIDVELLSGTLFYGDYNNDAFDINYDGKDNDVKDLAKHMVSNNRLDYGKYRNYLVDTYIEKRFDNLIDKSDKDNSIESIADEIMSFASMNFSINTEEQNSISYISNICPEICVEGGKCYDLEDYVAGVVEGESGPFKDLIPNAYKEQWKAQAVAARSYALYFTNWCEKPIPNNANVQAMVDGGPLHDEILEVISATEGQVLTYDNEVIAAEYDSFYLENNFHCDDELCYATYEKKGLESNLNNEKHEIVSYFKWKDRFLNGHGRGMSQYGAAYLADIGWNYEKILSYYYDDNVQLSYMGNSFKTGEFMDGLLFPLGVNSKTGICVTAGEYYSSGVYHGAVDIGGVDMGYLEPYKDIPVIASIGGKITVLTNNQWCSNSNYINGDSRLPVIPGCIGNNVTITVTDKNSKYYNYSFIYYHLDSVDPNLKVGDDVQSGQFLGYMGSTGNSTGYHLHYDIRNASYAHLNSTPVPDMVTGMLRDYCKNNVGG